MERLLYSSSPTPLKNQIKSSLFLPRRCRVDSLELSCPTSKRPEFRGINSLCCKYEHPSSSSSPSPPSSFSIALGNLTSSSASAAASPNGILPDPQFLKEIAIWFSAKIKGWKVQLLERFGDVAMMPANSSSTYCFYS